MLETLHGGGGGGVVNKDLKKLVVLIGMLSPQRTWKEASGNSLKSASDNETDGTGVRLC